MSVGTVAVVGLGAMGGPLAHHLVDHSERVLVFDVDPGRVSDVEAAGATKTSLSHLRNDADWILLSLPGPREVNAVVSEILRSPGTLSGIVDLTSNDPRVSRDIAMRCESQGITMIDAGVLGNPPLARSGDLILLMGASESEIMSFEPLLATISRLRFPLGKRGSGHAAKLAANELFTAQVAAMAEALTILHGTGADTEVFLEAIGATGGRGLGLADIGNTMLGEPPALGFALRLAAKDVRLLKSLADDEGRALPVLAGLHTLYQAAADSYPDDDYTRVFLHLADRT